MTDHSEPVVPPWSPQVERVASECDLYGHDYEVREPEVVRDAVRDWSRREPESVFCSRCGKSWKVER